jgi:hypothetical protein
MEGIEGDPTGASAERIGKAIRRISEQHVSAEREIGDELAHLRSEVSAISHVLTQGLAKAAKDLQVERHFRKEEVGALAKCFSHMVASSAECLRDESSPWQLDNSAPLVNEDADGLDKQVMLSICDRIAASSKLEMNVATDEGILSRFTWLEDQMAQIADSVSRFTSLETRMAQIDRQLTDSSDFNSRMFEELTCVFERITADTKTAAVTNGSAVASDSCVIQLEEKWNQIDCRLNDEHTFTTKMFEDLATHNDRLWKAVETANKHCDESAAHAVELIKEVEHMAAHALRNVRDEQSLTTACSAVCKEQIAELEKRLMDRFLCDLANHDRSDGQPRSEPSQCTSPQADAQVAQPRSAPSRSLSPQEQKAPTCKFAVPPFVMRRSASLGIAGGRGGDKEIADRSPLRTSYVAAPMAVADSINAPDVAMQQQAAVPNSRPTVHTVRNLNTEPARALAMSINAPVLGQAARSPSPPAVKAGSTFAMSQNGPLRNSVGPFIQSTVVAPTISGRASGSSMRAPALRSRPSPSPSRSPEPSSRRIGVATMVGAMASAGIAQPGVNSCPHWP